MRFFDKKNTAFLFLCIVVLLTLFVRLRHLNIAFERDEGEYAYAAQEILRGGLPYIDFYNMKLPGTYYFFALMFAIGGDSAITVKIGLLIVNLLNAFLVFLIARRIVEPSKKQSVGFFGAAAYLLFSLSYEAQGWTANSEHFVIFPALIGSLIVIVAHQTKRLWLYFFAGVFLIWAFISKQHALGYVVFPPIWLFFEAFKEKRWRVRFANFFYPMLYYSLGVLSVWGLLLAYFYHHNALDDLYFFTFQYASAYVGQEVPFKAIWHFRPIFWNNPIFWYLHFAVLYFAIRQSSLFKERTFIFSFWFCAFLCIHPGWFYRPHYFQLLFPAAAVLAGIGMAYINEFWKKVWQRIHVDNPQLVLWLGLLISCITQFGYYFTWSSEKVTDTMYPNANFSEIRDISYLLPKIMSDTGTIGMIGAEPQVAFYAKKQNASGFLYHYPIYEKHRFALSMADQFIGEMEKKKPEILFYFCPLEQVGVDFNSETMVKIQEWYQDFRQNYELVGKFRNNYIDYSEMCWRDKGYDMAVDTAAHFYILKRKNK